MKEAGIVERDSHSNNQGTANVEDKNTPEYTTNSLDDVAAGVLSLGSGATVVRVSQ